MGEAQNGCPSTVIPGLVPGTHDLGTRSSSLKGASRMGPRDKPEDDGNYWGWEKSTNPQTVFIVSEPMRDLIFHTPSTFSKVSVKSPTSWLGSAVEAPPSSVS